MWDEEPPREPIEGEPIPFLPADLPEAESELELVAGIWSGDSHKARAHACQLVDIARLARRRRAERDTAFGPRGRPGLDSRSLRSAVLADVSDDFITELALIRQCSEHEASQLAVEALLLTTKLAATWSELHAGRIDERKARAMIDLLGDATDDVAAQVQARVLPTAEGRTASDFRDRVRYHLYRLDEEAKERRRRDAERRADVHVERTSEGLGRLVVDGPLPGVCAARDAVDQYAKWMRADGDTRPIGVLRAAAALDLILRPWDTRRPPVTAQLTVHAPLPALRPDAGYGQPAADVNGQIITATQCRELLEQLGMLELRSGPAGSSTHVAIAHPDTGEVVAVATRAQLRRAAGGNHRHRHRHRHRPSHRDSPPADRSHTAPPGGAPPGGAPGGPAPRSADDDGPGLRPPPTTTAYRPTAAQRRHVMTRDRHCRMPGCRRRPGRCDIDHGHAYSDGGPTDCRNLCCLCRRHHRIKTFAPGWSFTLLPDGRLIVGTPSGVSRTTRPPGWYHDPEPEPPWLDEQAPPDPTRS
jgi:hypothetical protein